MPPDAPVLARLPDADEALTAALGRALAAEMRAGDVMLLDGPLGAGKTHLARAFIRARLGSPAEDVPSPSFTLVQTYDADPPVWHVDLYRLGDPSETAELGLDEAGVADLARAAVRHSFADDATKASILAEIDDQAPGD